MYTIVYKNVLNVYIQMYRLGCRHTAQWLGVGGRLSWSIGGRCGMGQMAGGHWEGTEDMLHR